MKNNNMVELEAVHDSRKSFYKKAHTLLENNKKYLISYTTTVAKIEDGKLEVFGMHSATTTRHIKEFILQNGFKSGTTKEIIEMYIK